MSYSILFDLLVEILEPAEEVWPSIDQSSHCKVRHANHKDTQENHMRSQPERRALPRHLNCAVCGYDGFGNRRWRRNKQQLVQRAYRRIVDEVFKLSQPSPDDIVKEDFQQHQKQPHGNNNRNAMPARELLLSHQRIKQHLQHHHRKRNRKQLQLLCNSSTLISEEL